MRACVSSVTLCVCVGTVLVQCMAARGPCGALRCAHAYKQCHACAMVVLCIIRDRIFTDEAMNVIVGLSLTLR